MEVGEEARLYQAQRTRNALLSSDTDSAELLTAAMKAPPVQSRFPDRKGGGSSSSATGPPGDHREEGGALATAFGHTITLVLSPFPNRRATILFTAYDLPWDGEWKGPSSSPSRSRSAAHPSTAPAAPPTGSDITEFVVPTRLTLCSSPHHDNEAGQEDGPRVKVLTLTKDGGGPYGRPLTCALADDAVPFTGVLTTLTGAGFTLVRGRAALLHKAWSLRWLKRPLKSDFLSPHVAKFQKLNHFPGTWRIGRKDMLHRQLTRARLRWEAGPAGEAEVAVNNNSKGGGDPCVFPEGWIVPDDLEACTAALRAPGNAGRLFIVKPAASACGRGVSLLRGSKDVVIPLSATSGAVPASTRSRTAHLAASTPQGGGHGHRPEEGREETIHDRLLIQRYLDDSFLVHGYKFDLRLYVVVTSYEPCRFYLYREGLVRLATTPYKRTTTAAAAAAVGSDDEEGDMAPLDDLTAHLTNFTISKKSEDFVAPQVGGGQRTAGAATTGGQEAERRPVVSKWSLAALEAHVRSFTVGNKGEENGTTPRYDWDATMASIHDLLCKTFLSVTGEVREELAELEAQRTAMDRDSKGESDGAAYPPLTFHGVSPFFEIYGVDVLLRKPAADAGGGRGRQVYPQPLRPALMEVNIMPSLSTHYTPLDQCIKGNFIADALTLVGLSSPLIKPSRRTRTPCPRVDSRSSSPSPSPTAAAATGEADAPAVSPYDNGFLGGLDSRTALEACYTAEEERLRAEHFTRLMPTATSATQYASLLPVPTPAQRTGSSSSDTCGGRSLDAVLSDYEAWRVSQKDTKK